MGTDFATGFSGADAATDAGRQAAQQALEAFGGDTPDFSVVFCSPSYEFESVVSAIRTELGEIPLVGGSAVGEFTDEGVMTDMASEAIGVTVAVVGSDEMQFFTGLGRDADVDAEQAVAEAVTALPESVEGYPHLTGLVISSTIGRGEEIAWQAYQQHPIQWVGGAASDLRQENMAVFVDDDVVHDGVALAVVASERPLGIATGHGHEPIDGPFEVTEAERNVVYELDGRPAYDVWKEAVEDAAEEYYGVSVDEVEHDEQRLFQLMAEMTFGVRTGDGEYKVRSPGIEPRTDGPLRFTDPIPKGTVLYAMASREEGAIERASDGMLTAADGVDDVSGGLVFDCLCGELVLGEDYYRAVEAMDEAVEAPFAGALSFGEICLANDDMRGFHNGSVSILLFPG